MKYDRFLAEKTREFAKDLEALGKIAESFQVEEVVIYHNIKDMPADYVIYQSACGAAYSLIDSGLLKQFERGEGTAHFPVSSPRGLKIIDSNGDNITSLYFPHRVLLKVSEATFQITEDPNLSYVSAIVDKYDFRSPDRLVYELLVDEDETLLYRSMAPYQTCFMEENQLVFKTPGFPKVYLRHIEDQVYEASIDSVVGRTIRGFLSKIVLQVNPFPFLIFSFSEATCDGEFYDELDLPSFYLFDWSALNSQSTYEISAGLVKKKLAAKAEKPKLS